MSYPHLSPICETISGAPLTLAELTEVVPALIAHIQSQAELIAQCDSRIELLEDIIRGQASVVRQRLPARGKRQGG